MLGSKALLIVDGSPPKGVAVGETFLGVKVISTEGDHAVVEIAGKRQAMRVGDAPSSVGGSIPSSVGGARVVLSASSGGHFMTQGQINGKAAQFMVDTGATVVSISQRDAERMGLNFRSGQVVQMSTANGVITGWRIKLTSVQVGDVVVYGVDAVVNAAEMPFVLLGNSFLTRFNMTRTNDKMVLEKQY
ncbi:TIGR02281 family clan AA aspartic protease [Rhodoferax aquaticus]|uniref:TIGR02281 family clan AA aspartic protease n=2 Tax=Rhodoferax aquaticus TaxID=2527691 RepID=A0A515EVM0_9BURK|nr:TIGR02281 family clan AA aspartic protease [Rhodoferax aquaticus]